MKKFSFLKLLFSPFKLFRIKVYYGEIKHGTPYFLPRTWIRNQENKNILTAVNKKFGIDIVELGYKTKLSDSDYRLEWEPLISFVCFNRQLCIFFTSPDERYEDIYWESWLYYENNTDKNLSVKERLLQLKKELPEVYISSLKMEKRKIQFASILKKKYSNI